MPDLSGARVAFSSPARSSVGASRASDWLALALLLVLTSWALLPTLRGEFVTDDYVFLATSRMVDAPWAAFWQRHFYEPLYFRPIGLVVWWLTQKCFGLDYALHAAFNGALHLINVMLLWLLLRRFVLGVWARAMGVAWFAVGPLSVSAVFWLSDRFDLLAVLFLLLLLLTVSSRGRVTRKASLAFLAALAACWSKEWAFAGCFVAMFGLAWAAWRWRDREHSVAAIAVLLAVAMAAIVRVTVLDSAATALVSNAVGVDRLGAGAGAWMAAMGGIAVALSAQWSMGLFVATCLISLAVSRGYGRTWVGDQAVRGRRIALLGATVIMFAAISLPQTLTVSGYIDLIDTSIFGVATTARFFYGPMAAAGAVVAILLSATHSNWVVRWAVVAVSGACVVLFAVVSARAASDFSTWTQSEIAPLSTAAVSVADRAVMAGDTKSCALVFLGTQTNHPYFRMFSDVTVKARTSLPDKVWSCLIVTEGAPWLFAFPVSVVPPELTLRPVANPDGKAKPDSVWSSIRYRYRLPAKDLAGLPGARFFDWQDGRFVDVTDAVRSGARKVASKDR